MAQLCALRLLAAAAEAGWQPEEQSGNGPSASPPPLPVTAITFSCPALADAGLAEVAARSLGAGVAIRNYSAPEDVVPTILSSPEATMLFVAEGEEGEEAAGAEEGGGGGGGASGSPREASSAAAAAAAARSSPRPIPSSSRSRFPPRGPVLGGELRARAAEVAREWEERGEEDWSPAWEPPPKARKGEAAAGSSASASSSAAAAAEAFPAAPLGEGAADAAAADPPLRLRYRLGRAADAAALAAASGARSLAASAAAAAARAALLASLPPRRVGAAVRDALVSRYRSVGAQFFVCEDGVRGPVAPFGGGGGGGDFPPSSSAAAAAAAAAPPPPLFSLPSPPPSLCDRGSSPSSSSRGGTARSFVPLPNREAAFAPGEVNFDLLDLDGTSLPSNNGRGGGGGEEETSLRLRKGDSLARVHRMAFLRARLAGVLHASVAELLPRSPSASPGGNGGGGEADADPAAAAAAAKAESSESGSESSVESSSAPRKSFWRRRRERRQRQRAQQQLLLQPPQQQAAKASPLPTPPSVSLDAAAVAPLPAPERAEALVPREALFPSAASAAPSSSSSPSSSRFFSSPEEEVEVDVVVTGRRLWLVRSARLSLPSARDVEEEEDGESAAASTRLRGGARLKKKEAKKTTFAAAVIAAPPLPALLPPPTGKKRNAALRLWAAARWAVEAAVGSFARGGGDVLLVRKLFLNFFSLCFLRLFSDSHREREREGGT